MIQTQTRTSLFETFGDDFPNSYFTNSVPAIIAFYSNNNRR